LISKEKRGLYTENDPLYYYVLSLKRRRTAKKNKSGSLDNRHHTAEGTPGWHAS
jgi:hypothetical protein